MVAVDPPPPCVAPDPLFLVVPKGATIVRLYDPLRHGAHALSFPSFGPISRFDHHRAPYPTKSEDPDRGIVYGASKLSSCLVEIFGDSKVVETGTWEVAALTTTRPLKLLDLRGPGAVRAGTVSAISKESSRRFSQEWSRFFYDTTFAYTAVDGLVFYNAHNDEEAFAFYERASDAFKRTAVDVRPLRHDSLRAAVRDIASTNGLFVQPY